VSQEDFERAVVRAERLVRNQGGVWEDELECRETLFGAGGLLELWSWIPSCVIGLCRCGVNGGGQRERVGSRHGGEA
jgi:hypothetical protein